MKAKSTKSKGSKAETVRIEGWKQHKLASYTLNNLKGSDFVQYRDSRLRAGESPSTVRLEFNMACKEWGFEGLNLTEVAAITGHKDLNHLKRYMDLK